MGAERWVLHADMDCFFAAVEVLRHPELAGKPVLVGGDGRRGVVAAASYEARASGVGSAMAMTEAIRRCPVAVVLPGDHEHYGKVSARFMAILGELSPLVEPLSLDEAYVELTGSERRLGDPVVTAARLRSRIHDELGLWASVGLAPNKLAAKLASEAAKPTPDPRVPIPGPGVVVIRPSELTAFLQALPVRALPGVGPAAAEKLGRLGVGTVAELTQVGEASLRRLLGAAGARQLTALARGDDPRPVVASAPTKSISSERTFASDRADAGELEGVLARMADGVATRLRAADLSATTVHIKVRFGDFRLVTRSQRLEGPTDSTATIREVAWSLLSRLDLSPGVRLFGIGVSGLATAAPAQLRLDRLSVDEERTLDRTVDDVRRRFGSEAIGPARLVDGSGVREHGDQADKGVSDAAL
ncbi:MAG: DNA polymerase IV [Microthrixaceae bacterium]|nr:DNA polymerase IV [Microthrixaceae bacterium]